MPLIGTAGHVDHGKSTLIERITGRDPDRWEEEKKRGLTIDLGFAWTTLPGGVEVSFVDVPGHERYLKNMLAGIEAVDAALLVVAADEGWMPQSEEHLAVLDLLEVRRGAVALSKIDRVEQELVELARAEILEHLEGSTLEGVSVHPVSGVTGEGVDALLEDLARQVTEETTGDGRPRMWIDRVFTVSGAGTVVTGTLLGDSLAVDDTVEIHPKGIQGRIRSMQSHERSHDRVEAGRRVALNLAGIDSHEVERGDMVGAPGQWETSRRFSATLRPARFVEEIDRKGAYHLHIGSGAHRVDILGIDDGFAVLRTDDPLPLTVGDRFILRDTGRKVVVGGGRVLDPAPGRTRKALTDAREVDLGASPDVIADWLLALRGVETIHRLRAHSAGGSPPDAIPAGDRVVSPALVEELAKRAAEMVDRVHDRHPLRAGLPIATLAERLDVERGIAELVVERSDELERRGPDVARPHHRAGLDKDQDRNWQKARERLAESLAVPTQEELGLDEEVIHLKLREGELIRISPDLVYLPDQIEQIKTILSGLEEDFTVAEFRDAAGLSRKYAVPILEWSDKEGLTFRRGNVRRLR